MEEFEGIINKNYFVQTDFIATFMRYACKVKPGYKTSRIYFEQDRILKMLIYTVCEVNIF